MASNIEMEDLSLGNKEHINLRLNESQREHVHRILMLISEILIIIFRACWFYFASLFSCFKGLFLENYIAVPILFLSSSILTAAVITLSGLERLIIVIYCLSFSICSIVTLCCKQGAIVYINDYQQMDQQENDIDPQNFQEVGEPIRDSPQDEKLPSCKALRNLLEPIPENTILETKINPNGRRKLGTSHDSCTSSNHKDYCAAGPSSAPDPFSPMNRDNNRTSTSFSTPDSNSSRARSGTYNITGEDETHFLTSTHFIGDDYHSHGISHPLSEVLTIEDTIRKFKCFLQSRLSSYLKSPPSYSKDYSAAGPSHAPDPFPQMDYGYENSIEPSEITDQSPSLNQDDNKATTAFQTSDSSSLSARDKTYIISSEDITDLSQSTHFDDKGCDSHEIPQRLSQARLSSDAIRTFGPPDQIFGANSYRISYSSDENCIYDEQDLFLDSSDPAVGGNTFEASAEVYHSDSYLAMSSNNVGSGSVELESIPTDECARGAISDSLCNLLHVDGNQSSKSSNIQ